MKVDPKDYQALVRANQQLTALVAEAYELMVEQEVWLNTCVPKATIPSPRRIARQQWIEKVKPCE